MLSNVVNVVSVADDERGIVAIIWSYLCSQSGMARTDGAVYLRGEDHRRLGALVAGRIVPGYRVLY